MASVTLSRNQWALLLMCGLTLVSLARFYHLRTFTSAGTMVRPNSFLYFAFGSNLLTERIHIGNPSAVMLRVGKLKDYRLDFNFYSHRWHGAVATIVESPGDHVYGVLWEINNEDLVNLDKQEGVHQGIYRPIEIEIETDEEEIFQARSYQLLRMEEEDHRPSAVYKNVILKGARQNGLPEEYIRKLEQIEDNGYTGSVNVKLDEPS